MNVFSKTTASVLVAALACVIWVSGVKAQTSPSPARRPSLYAGVGNGTNLGGHLGTGLEVPFRLGDGAHLALNVAGGFLPRAQDAYDPSRFDFDVGVKLYPLVKQQVFVGLNYGLYRVDEVLTFYGKTRTVSLIAGWRVPLRQSFYLNGYIGTSPLLGGAAYGLTVGREISVF